MVARIPPGDDRRGRESEHAREISMMGFRKRSECTVLAVTAVLILFFAPPMAPAENAKAQDTVDRLHSALIEVMKNADALGFEGRWKTLAPVVTDSYDLAYISEIVLGREWDKISQDDRRQMIDTFTRLTVSTYAARFDGFSGESFRHMEEKPMNRGRMLVRTELVRPADEPVHLDYVLHEKEGQWRIVNVVAEGVSDLSLKRADYGSIIKQEGFKKLLEKLETQIVALQAGA